MNIDFLIDNFKKFSGNECIVWKSETLTYKDLLTLLEGASSFVTRNGISKGSVVALNGDFTPNSIALLFALILNDNIIVPFTKQEKESIGVKLEIAQAEFIINVNIGDDTFSIEKLRNKSEHEYYEKIRSLKVAGLVLFTSGTSGRPKAAVHNFQKLLKKFEKSRKSFRTINFLLFDHWGGLNTLFNSLSNFSLVIPVLNRNPKNVCELIEKYKIQLLPVSPSFLNLLIIGESFKDFDLNSLELITYGSEPMPESTLLKAQLLFKNVKFQQTYGLIELGVLRSKSKDDGSLWVKLGGEGYELRVIDNLLEIKAESAMLGYLNAPSPFTEDGYFMTGDMVETNGEFFKILGRKSEIINVGGEKVYPQEVENLILQYPGVKDVTVFGEKNAIMGNIVCANIFLEDIIDEKAIAKEIKFFCKQTLASFKVPVKVKIQTQPLFNNRYKKKRN
jgi:long-chain acyl-CoA synthetase